MDCHVAVLVWFEVICAGTDRQQCLQVLGQPGTLPTVYGELVLMTHLMRKTPASTTREGDRTGCDVLNRVCCIVECMCSCVCPRSRFAQSLVKALVAPVVPPRAASTSTSASETVGANAVSCK